MTDGVGRALDAGAATESNVPATEPTPDEVAAARAAEIAEADRIVDASRAKVAVQEQHLAGAHDALDQAVADREGLD